MAATIREYYNTGDDNYSALFLTQRLGQTFTTSDAYTITSSKLKLYKVGAPTGNITVSIRAASGGKPTGGDLCSGTLDSSTLTTNAAGAWYEISLGAGYFLSASTQYAIVAIHTLDDYPNNYVAWRRDQSSPTYAGGTMLYTTNATDDTWTIYDAGDHMFECWGEDISVGTTGAAFLLHFC